MGHQIYLKNNQVALIIDENGWQSLHLPKSISDDDIVPDFITYLTTIAILIKTDDKKFQKYLAKRFNEIVRKNK